MFISIIKDGERICYWLMELISFAKLIHLRYINAHQLKLRLMGRGHCVKAAFYCDEAL